MTGLKQQTMIFINIAGMAKTQSKSVSDDLDDSMTHVLNLETNAGVAVIICEWCK